MSDLVKRLRNFNSYDGYRDGRDGIPRVAHEAAAEIERLQAENERLRAEAIPVEALAWLFGTGPDHHGKWFDESKDAQPSTGSNRPYWWRPYFRKVIEGYRDALGGNNE